MRSNGRYLRSRCKRCEADIAAQNRPDVETKRTSDARYRERHKDSISKRDRKYREANRQQLSSKKRAYQQSHRAQHAAASRRHQQLHPETHAAAQTRRRVRLRSGEVAPYSRREVFERDEGICWLCDEPIEWGLHGWLPEAFSIDHVTPVSRGGADTLDNVKSAHRKCNVLMGVKDVA